MIYNACEQSVQDHICWFGLENQALRRMALQIKCPIQSNLVLSFKNLRDSHQEKWILLFVSFVMHGDKQVMTCKSMVLIE